MGMFCHFFVTPCHFGKKKGQNRSSDLMFSGGGEGNRTPDTGIFSPLLYQLSYPAKTPALASLYILTKDMPLSTLYSDETPIF